jgi:GntR family transcriptional repressor for pyruvate dehydrogenase complex
LIAKRRKIDGIGRFNNMGFTRITNERLSDKVAQSIIEQIETGELKPGDKLPNELELAEELGISRGILREALTILQAREYIVRKPKDGTLVNPDIMEILRSKNGISLKEATYIDLLEMRECVEERVVEKVVDLASDEKILELEEFLNPIQEQINGNSVDYYFHYKLAELSQNAMFVNFIDTYYDVIDELTKKTTQKKSRKTEINQEHRKIVEYIVKRDKEKAVNAMLEHLRKVKENIKRT